MSKPKVDQRFIVNLKGKDFVTYEGLLDTAHQIGIKSIETKLVQLPSADNDNTAVAMARITTNNDEVFVEVGDASPKSVNRMIGPHIIRMAFTRAKARALRDLTNIGMTALEELGEDVIEQVKPANKKKVVKETKEDKATKSQVDLLNDLLTEQRKEGLKNYYGVASLEELTFQQAKEAILIAKN